MSLAQQIEAEYLNALEKFEQAAYRRFEANQGLDLAQAGAKLQGLRVQAAQRGITMAEKQRSRAHFLAGKYQQRIDAADSGVNDPARCPATEAVAVTEAALALAGCEMDQFTYALTARMARGELTGDQAVEAILTRFMRASD